MTEVAQYISQHQAAFLLVLVRVGAFVAALPMIGGNGVPNSFKALLTLALAAALFPLLPPVAPPADGAVLAVGVMAEVFVGVVIGFATRLLFAAVEIGGELAGLQMGLGIATLFDPATQQDASIVARLQGLMALVLLFALNAHHVILRTLFASFERLPPLGLRLTGPLFEHLMRLTAEMFALGLAIGVPVTLALLLVNLALGILFRIVPQLNVFLVSFPITIGLGLLVTGASLSLFVGLMQARMSGWDGMLVGLLTEMRAAP